MPSHRPRTERLCLPLAVAATVLISSCYTFTTKAQKITAATQPQRQVVYTYVWGLYNSPQILPADNCAGEGIASVTVHTNLGYNVISVVTFGFVMPMEVEWLCAKDEPEKGELP